MGSMFKNYKRYYDADVSSSSQSKSAPRSGMKMYFGMKKDELNDNERKKLIEAKKENAAKRKAKKKRLIIRNLSFKVNEEELRKLFSKYGNIHEISIPRKPDGKSRGFAFVQFEEFKSCVLAIKKLNYKKIHGRPVALDYALAKSEFEHVTASRKVSGDIKQEPDDTDDEENDIGHSQSAGKSPDNENPDDDSKLFSREDKVSKFMKELQFKVESDDEGDEQDSVVSAGNDSSESDEDNMDIDGDNSDAEDRVQKMPENRKKDAKSETSFKDEIDVKQDKKPYVRKDDVQEGKTVFVRNISFETCEEDFQEAMEEIGPVSYCVFCVDKLTDHPKGTAFVKYERKEDADKLIERSNSEDGLSLDGRKLNCVLALTRQEVQSRFNKDPEQKKDKRNLRLLNEGLIRADSEEAEGVSQADLAKRAKLEAMKKRKLKNLNFFVSDKRLSVHNLPGNYTDKQLRKLFMKASGQCAVITEAKVMKNLQSVNEKGEAKSKGFGFVTFTEHDHALKALHTINNNPDVFTALKRPIVEFSIENHLALLKKQKTCERNKQLHKKIELSNQESQKEGGERSHQEDSSSHKDKSKKNKRKKEQKKPKKKKKSVPVNDAAFDNLVNKYKGKLLNKMK